MKTIKVSKVSLKQLELLRKAGFIVMIVGAVCKQ